MVSASCEKSVKLLNRNQDANHFGLGRQSSLHRQDRCGLYRSKTCSSLSVGYNSIIEEKTRSTLKAKMKLYTIDVHLATDGLL